MATDVYLSTLANDEVLFIARHLSKHPVSRRWLDFVSPEDRKMLFTKDGEFGRAIHEHFTHICINETFMLDNCVNLVGTGDPLTLKVVEDFGSSFTRASITDRRLPTQMMYGTFPVKPVSADILEAFNTKCDSIRRLSLFLDSESTVLFAKRGFFLQNPSILEHFQLKFRCVESYRLTFPSFPNLKILDIEGPRLQQIVQLLQMNRKVLEEVMLVSKKTVWTSVITALGNCTKLRKIELEGDVPQEKYARLLVSVGTKLERAILMNMNNTLCKRVLESCPNLMCDVEIRSSNVDKLQLFGKHVRKLTLEQPASGEWTGLTSAADNCSAVTDIYCMGQKMEVDLLSSLFNTPKTALENLEFVVTMLCVSGEVLDRIRIATGNLRRLNLVVFKFEEFEALAKLLRANQKLEHVELLQRNGLPSERASRMEDAMTYALIRHPKLRNLSLKF